MSDSFDWLATKAGTHLKVRGPIPALPLRCQLICTEAHGNYREFTAYYKTVFIATLAYEKVGTKDVFEVL